jgi:hypothetical protein
MKCKICGRRRRKHWRSVRGRLVGWNLEDRFTHEYA